MPAPISDLLADLDGLLEPERFEDYCLNGLQVPGGEQVSTIATAVSANGETFEMATAEGADLLLVHHGLFWGSGVRAIDPILARRLRILFEANVALAAYHLGQPIGFIAALPGEGLPATDLFERVQSITGREPLVFDAGPERVRRLAIVSGAGADYLAAAAAAGADGLLTGEVPERAMAEARERGLHLIAAGHYATETFGVRCLGERLAERFSLRHIFLDVPNPI
jgi:putative NIF3 family GTP cyclohydrolase 1 type 2